MKDVCNSRCYRLHQHAQLSFQNIRQNRIFRLQNIVMSSKSKVARKSVARGFCQTITTRPSQENVLAWPEWHDYNNQGEPHQNSLEAAFSLRQYDYSVEIRVSYFYHISSKSGFPSIHREVITSHFGEKPAQRLLDREIECCHGPQGLYHNRRGVQLKDWNEIKSERRANSSSRAELRWKTKCQQRWVRLNRFYETQHQAKSHNAQKWHKWSRYVMCVNAH